MAIDKKLDAERASRYDKMKKEITKKAPYISTGLTLLDESFGGGDVIARGGMGIKVGDMVNVYGNTGVGKSFLFNELIASAKRKVESGGLKEHGITKFKWYYDDIEKSDNFDAMGLYGFEIHPPDKPKASVTVEDCCYRIQNELHNLKSDELLIYVVDSLDALTSRAALAMNADEVNAFKKGKEVNKGSFNMQKGLFLSTKFFQPISDAREGKNVIILVVSQIRLNVNAGMFDKKTKTSNTETLKFYFDTRMELLPVQKYYDIAIDPITGEKKEQEIGGCVKCRPAKVRHSRPNREVLFDFFYLYGLDNVGCNIDYLYGLRDERYKLRTAEKYKNLQFPPQSLDKTYEKANLGNIRAWLKEIVPEAGVKSTTGKEELESIINTNNLRPAYLEKFGSGLDREGLINYIVDNDLEEELHKAVLDKWENMEGQVAHINRKKKW